MKNLVSALVFGALMVMSVVASACGVCDRHYGEYMQNGGMIVDGNIDGGNILSATQPVIFARKAGVRVADVKFVVHNEKGHFVKEVEGRIGLYSDGIYRNLKTQAPLCGRDGDLVFHVAETNTYYVTGIKANERMARYAMGGC